MKKSLMIAAGILYFTSVATVVTAQPTIAAKKKTEITEPLTVRFLGSDNDYLIFRVEIKTGNISSSEFRVEDASEGVLYANSLSTNSKYQLMKIEKRDYQVLDFKLVSGKKIYVKTFTTDSNSKLYQKGVAVL